VIKGVVALGVGGEGAFMMQLKSAFLGEKKGGGSPKGHKNGGEKGITSARLPGNRWVTAKSKKQFKGGKRDRDYVVEFDAH